MLTVETTCLCEQCLESTGEITVIEITEEQDKMGDWEQPVSGLCEACERAGIRAARQAEADERADAYKGPLLAELTAALNARGWAYTVNGYGGSGASYYVKVADRGTVRISDHAQPVNGGYSEARGERHGEALISLDPATGYAVADAVAALNDIEVDA